MNVVLAVVAIVGYIACGVLAYGLMKGGRLNMEERWQREAKDRGIEYVPLYENWEEFPAIFLALFGPIGLIVALLAYMIMPEIGGSPRLCFRMPKEHCR